MSSNAALLARANACLPSLTHLASCRPEGCPTFFASGSGCRVTDADGREWLDYMCSYGPVLLGHRHPAVEAAIAAQRLRGDCLSGPTERMVELGELLVATIPWASWSFFAKNGGDATELAVRMARAQTGRRVVLRAPQSYHGASPLWREGSDAALAVEGVEPSASASLRPYAFNDLRSVVAAADEAFEHGGVAAIIVAAFKWDWGVKHEAATAEFLRGVRRLCDERGAALICDDVRSSFRVNAGGTWEDERYGHGVRPDLSCLSKGMANGQPLSAVVGSHRWRKGAEAVRATGTFWANAVPFAAALATIPLARAAAERAEATGTALRDGLRAQARAAGLGEDFGQSGPPQMPLFHFDSEGEKPPAQRRKIVAFCRRAAEGGVLLHPFHTMFVGGAHSLEDVEQTLSVTQLAFEAVVNLDPQ